MSRRWTVGRWLLFAVAAGDLLASACTTMCTLIGGEDGLIVDLQVTGGVLPPGEYTLVARVGGGELRVDEMLTGDGAALKSEAPEVVVDGKHLFLHGAVLGEWGTLQVGFREGGGPAAVTIEIWRGGAMIGQESYAPKYQEARPNGEQCPPALEQARASLVIAAPSA